MQQADVAVNRGAPFARAATFPWPASTTKTALSSAARRADTAVVKVESEQELAAEDLLLPAVLPQPAQVASPMISQGTSTNLATPA
jgi:hypothetical protein